MEELILNKSCITIGEDKVVEVNYEGSDIPAPKRQGTPTLELRSGGFSRSTIKGSIKGLDVPDFYSCELNYEGVVFEDCTFGKDSFIDGAMFRKCVFVDCFFFGKFRWVEFYGCKFENTHFDMKYMRASTLSKNCKFDDMTLTVDKIDEYIHVSGKRYSVDNNPLIMF